jgi:murein DD-endopeptidase MepM/ murein hydrolase activator NlpD
MFETLDAELATHLARAKGLGLADELLAAFDRMEPKPPTTESAPAAVPATRADLKVGPHRSTLVGAGSTFAGAGLQAGPPIEAGPSGSMVRPVSGAVTSDFGWRRDPFTSRLKFHQGVDMRAAYGQEVQAAGAGKVVFSGEQGGYGTSVVIQHEDGTRTRYAHLSAALVEVGNEVQAGAPVGRAGRSGRATGTHLHFEVIGRDGRRMAPQQWASADTAGRTLPGMDERRTARSAD